MKKIGTKQRVANKVTDRFFFPIFIFPFSALPFSNTPLFRQTSCGRG